MRDELRFKALCDRAAEESKKINSKLNLDENKTKFTFTTDGKILILDDKKLKEAISNRVLNLPKLNTVSCLQLLKKGVETTREKVLPPSLDFIRGGRKSVMHEDIVSMPNPIETFDP